MDGRYEQVFLYAGGGEARRKVVGWASWRQVWPVVEAERATRDLLNIDVSDVDMNDIPAPDCEQYRVYTSSSSCRTWERVPETGVAGSRGGEGVVYLQVKGHLPEDEAQLETLRLTLYPP